MDSELELLPKNGILQLCRTVFIRLHLIDVKLKLCIIRGKGEKKNVFSVMQAELARCVVCYRWGQVKEPFVADHCCPCKTVESTASLGMNCFLGWVLQLWLFCSREKVA